MRGLSLSNNLSYFLNGGIINLGLSSQTTGVVLSNAALSSTVCHVYGSVLPFLEKCDWFCWNHAGIVDLLLKRTALARLALPFYLARFKVHMLAFLSANVQCTYVDFNAHTSVVPQKYGLACMSAIILCK